MAANTPAPKKKRGATVADKMSARTMSSVMDSSGTGDPMMDATLRGESNRRTAFANTAGTTAKAVTNGENSIMKALKRMFGGR